LSEYSVTTSADRECRVISATDLYGRILGFLDRDCQNNNNKNAFNMNINSNSVALVRERTILTEQQPLVGEVSTTFADRGRCVVSTTNPYGRILGLLDRYEYI
jgi:hypothetical protein